MSESSPKEPRICAVCEQPFTVPSDHAWWCVGSEGVSQEEILKSLEDTKKNSRPKK